MDFRAITVHEEKATRIGELHGSDRADNRHYELTEVIFEYHILREVIFQELETDGQLDTVQRDIILDSVEQAVNDAAVKFSEVHGNVRQQFTNTLTHDLKTPITTAKMCAELILRRTDVPQALLDLGKTIVGNMNRLDAMIHDLLDVSRLRAGETLTLQLDKNDLDKIVHQVLKDMSIIHGDRFKYNSKGPMVSMSNRDGLRRAIENLIGNAVKYGTPGTPITISLAATKGSTEITVHNLGPSIPEKEIPLLFQQHKRLKSAEESTKSGWGLGLSLVKGVMDAHKGKVRVESKEGKGTSFILEIPTAEAVAEIKKETRPAQATPTLPDPLI
jgi:signal transduction histidine kinase